MSAIDSIRARIISGRPFTYLELGCLNRHPATQEVDHDRLADRTIQKYRRAGWIAYERIKGKGTVWSLTGIGEAMVESGRSVDRAALSKASGDPA